MQKVPHIFLHATVSNLLYSFPDYLNQLMKKNGQSSAIGYTLEACIGVLGIQDICYFTSRDIRYFPFYFQGYRILCSISGIFLFFLHNIQIQSKTTNNINKDHFKIRSKLSYPLLDFPQTCVVFCVGTLIILWCIFCTF